MRLQRLRKAKLDSRSGRRRVLTVFATVLTTAGLLVTSLVIDVRPTLAIANFSGNAYHDEGVTAIDGSATNKTVNLCINGTCGVYTDEITTADGAWSISGVAVVSGDIVTVFLDNETEQATTVFVTDNTNQTNVHLYKNRVIVRADTGSITNANLGTGDSGDADIKYSVSAGNLTVDSGFELHVWTGDTYAPGGTLTTQGGGNLHIDTTATLNAAGNAITVNGSWDNDGTYTSGSNTVTFNSTASGNTLSGTLNGTSAFNKVTFNGVGGEWTIQDAMLVSAANATDTLIINNGTVTLGDGSGDNLEIRGAMDIAPTAGNNATFQTTAMAEGSTITIDVNQNTATPTCANCYIRVGVGGTGTMKIRKNTVVRLNPRSTATASDTFIDVRSGGLLEVQGSQDATGTSTATDSDALQETTLCSTNTYTNDEHNNKKVRLTSGLSYGRTYAITDTIADDANCATDTHDSLVRADTSSGDSTISSLTTIGPTRRVCAAANTLITANNGGVGQYLRNQTDDTYFLILDSTNNDATNCSSNDSFIILDNPDSFSGLATGETIDVSDGVKPSDSFEVLDYAHITAENGTACDATVDQAGEAYLIANADSDTMVQYAEICNLGRNTSGLNGVTIQLISGADADEGALIDTSEIHHNLWALASSSATNLTAANSSGITDNAIYNNGYGIFLFNNAATSEIQNNRIYNNSINAIRVNSTPNDSFTISGNYLYGGTGSQSLRVGGNSNTISANSIFNNTGSGLQFDSSASNNTTSANFIFSNSTFGIDLDAPNNTIDANTIMLNTDDGIELTTNNNVISANAMASVGGGASAIDVNPGHNNILRANTIFRDGGNRSINLNNSTGNVVQSNILTGAGASYGVYITNSGTASSNNVLFGNVLNNHFAGVVLDGTVANTGLVSANDQLGATTANTADIWYASAQAHKLSLYNSLLASSTEVATTISTTGAYLISRKHDQTNGLTRVWGEYTTAADVAETPQNEATEKYNYVNNLWEDSITAHRYNVGMGAGTEDTNLSFAFSGGSLGGDSSSFSYRVLCTAANCVTTADSWDVYRNGTLLTNKASTGSQYTDSQVDGGSAPNVQFTIEDAGTDYTQGAAYTFVAYKKSADMSNQKTVRMMQDGDVFTVASGTTLELKGESAGLNVTQVQRDTTGGYQFSINGAIDANAYSFDHLGGAGQASGLDINAGATITSLNNGSFDNFATNVGAADSFIDVASSLIGAGTPSKTITGMSFTNTGGNANCNVNATGADATGFWEFTGSVGTFGGENNDCNDGAADANPGQLWWPDSGITISGHGYSDEGVTPLDGFSDSKFISVSVNGVFEAGTGIFTADGAWSMPSVNAMSGDVITVYLDGETEKATTVFVSNGAAQTNVNLYQNRLIVRADTGSITNTSLATGDDGDADVVYSVSGANLTVDSGIELHVWTGDTYDPGGAVTTNVAGGDFHVDDDAVASLDTATSTIGGDVIVDGGASLTVEAATAINGGDITTAGTSATVTYTGTPTVTLTGTGSIGGGTTPSLTFYDLTVGTATAAATTAASSFTVANTLNVDTSDSLTISASQTVTHTGATLTLNGTIAGAGRLTYQSATAFPTTGSVSSIVRMDATNNVQTLSARTYGGQVEVYNNSAASARTVTLAAGTHTYSSHLYLEAANTRNITLSGTTNNPTLNISGSLDFIGSGSGSEIIATGTGIWTVGGSADFTNGTFTHTATGTLAMNGSGTLTSDTENLQNLTLSGTITLANAVHLINGNLDMAGGTVAAGTSTVTMKAVSGSIVGGGNTLNNLNIDEPGGAGVITLTTSDLTVAANLINFGTNELVIASGRTLTHAGELISVGTLSGDGLYSYGSATAFPTGGTVSVDVRFDATNNDQTMSTRAYGGDVEIYNDSGSSSRTVTMASGTPTLSGNLTLNANGTQNVTLSGSANNPTVNVPGDLDYTGTGSGSEAIVTGTGTWTASGNVDFSGGTATFTAGNTFQMNGSAKNLTSNGATLQNFAVTGGSITQVGSLDVNGTFSLSSGSFTQAAGSNLNVADDFTLSSGTTFTASTSGLLILDGDLTLTDNNVTKQDLGEVHIGISPDTTDLASDIAAKGVTVNSGDVLNTNGYDLTLGTSGLTVHGTFDATDDVETDETLVTTDGDVTISSGATFTADQSEIVFDAGSGTDNLVTDGAFSLYNLTLNGGMTVEVEDALDVDNDLTITSGTLDAKSGENNAIVVGGSWSNSGTFTARQGTVTFDSGDAGETVAAGSSDFYHLAFNNAGGGWTVQTDDLTATGNFSLLLASAFTLESGRTLAVQGDFSHAISGAATTWTGSTLYLNGSGALYDINSRTHGGDSFATLRVGATDQVAGWDLSATTFTIDSGGCLYSQDHTGITGQLNIYGGCNSRSNEYWSYATDFDGTALGGSSRQASVQFADGAAFTVDSGDTLAILGQSASTNPTAVTRQSSGNYGLTVNGTINAQFYDFDYLNSSGLNITATAAVTELANGSFDNIASGASASYITVMGITDTDTFADMVFDSNGDGVDANVVYNVNADGSGINWTFTNHSGNRTGEAYDREVNGAVLTWSTVFSAIRDGLGSDVDVTNSTTTLSANWTTSSDVGVDHFEYAIGTTSGGTDVVGFTSTGASKNFTNSSLSLTNGQTYYSTARAINASSEPMDSITTDGITVDTVACTFSSITASATTTTITVAWNSSEPCTSLVRYGLTSSYGSQTIEDTDLVTSHSQTISGLTTDTLYHFQVRGTDEAGNTGASADQTKRTGASENTVIINVQVSQITATSVAVTWDTNHPADSKVRYGLTTAYGGEVYDGALVTEHELMIENLEPDTTYHYEVISVGNTTAIDSDATFTTEAEEEEEPTPSPHVYVPIPTIVEPTANQWFIVPSPRISGLSHTGTTIRFHIDGEFVGTTPTLPSDNDVGWFYFTVPFAMSRGTHHLVVEARDADGNYSRKSEPLPFRVGLPTIGPTLFDIVTGTAVVNGLGWGDTDVTVYANDTAIGEFYIGGFGVRWFSFTLPITVDGRYAITMRAFDNQDKPSRLSNTVFYTHRVQRVEFAVPITNQGTHIVRPGDTLWNIATLAYGQGSLYSLIIEANKGTFPSLLFNPSLLLIGWPLLIP